MSKKYDDLFSIENPRAFAIEVMARHNFKSSEELAQFFKTMPYCIAPWLHSHLNPAGERKLCCVALPSGIEGTTSFDEYWNSQYMQEVREKMIAHTPPPECAHCVNFKGAGAQRSIYLHLLLGLPDLPNLKWSNVTSQKPVSLDYRINRHCNFSCRMCASTASSTIEHLEEKANIEFTENRITAEQFSHFKNEMFQLIQSGELLDLNFADGEPFISPLHWEILDYLVKNKLSKKVILRYSSNISTLNYKGIYIPSYFKEHFNKVFISMSIDGVKDTAEFVRDGFRWDSFYQNYQTLKKELGPKVVRFNITVSLPVLLEIEAMADFLDKEEIVYSIDSAYPMGHELILSPLALDKKSLEAIINTRLPQIKNAQMKQFLQSLLEHYDPKHFLELKKNFKAIRTYYIKIDATAKRSSTLKYLASKKELKDWWSSICPSELSLYEVKDAEWRFSWVSQALGRFLYKAFFRAKQLQCQVLFGRQVKVWYRNSLNKNFFQFAQSDIDVSVQLESNAMIKKEAREVKSALMPSLLIKEVNLYYPFSLKKLPELINRIEAKRDPSLLAILNESSRRISHTVEAEVFCWRMLLANKHLYYRNATSREIKKWKSYFELAHLSSPVLSTQSEFHFSFLVEMILKHFHQSTKWQEDVEKIAFYLINKIDVQTLYKDLDHPAVMISLFPQIFCSVDVASFTVPETLKDHFLAQLSWELASSMAQISGDGIEKDTLAHLEKMMSLIKSSQLKEASELLAEYGAFARFLRSGGVGHG